MNVFDKIIVSSPINKMAALVTGGSSIDETAAERLKKEVNDIDAAIQRAKSHHLGIAMVKDLGIKKLAIQEELHKLKDKRKEYRSSSIEFLFIDVCREHLSKHQFCLFMKEARKRARI